MNLNLGAWLGAKNKETRFGRADIARIRMKSQRSYFQNLASRPMMWKGLWLSEPQADPNLAPDVAEKWLFKTKIEIRVPFLQAKGCFSRSHTWFVYIQFLVTISSPFTPWSKCHTMVPPSFSLLLTSFFSEKVLPDKVSPYIVN